MYCNIQPLELFAYVGLTVLLAILLAYGHFYYKRIVQFLWDNAYAISAVFSTVCFIAAIVIDMVEKYNRSL